MHFKVLRKVKRNINITVSQLVVFQHQKTDMVKEQLIIGYSVIVGGIQEQKNDINTQPLLDSKVNTTDVANNGDDLDEIYNTSPCHTSGAG